jgi:VWFA-related protein
LANPQNRPTIVGDACRGRHASTIQDKALPNISVSRAMTRHGACLIAANRMRSIVAGLVALCILQAIASRAQTPVFPAGTERVIVDVVVTDGDGQPVAGLTREDFVVEDEGTPETITEFEAVNVAGPPAGAAAEPPKPSEIATNDPAVASPRAFLIVFDDLNLSPASGEKIAGALRKFLERQLRDTDCVTLVPTAGGAWWSGCLGSDRGDLDAALRAMRGRRRPNLSRERMSDYEAMRIYVDRDEDAMLHVALRYMAFGLAIGGGGSSTTRGNAQDRAADVAATSPMVQMIAGDVYSQAVARNERMLQSVERGVRALAGGRGRRVVILASDGFIRDQRLPGFQRVREAARRSNAALYFVDAENKEPDIATAEMAGHPDADNKYRYVAIAHEYADEENAGAETLAADTGGFTVRGTALDRGLARISTESRVFYLLGYAPSRQGKEGRFRKIKVSVLKPGVKVRARTGYYPGLAAADESPADAPPPAARAALDAVDDARAIPVRMTAYVLGNAAEGRIKVLLAGEVDPSAVTLKPANGRLNGGVASYSILAARDTGEVGRKDRVYDLALRPEAMPRMATTWLPVTHLYELPPGRYQARMVVVDRGSGRTGSVRHTFEVPGPSGLRLTTPVLTDVSVPGAGTDAPAQPVPVARRAFDAGSRLLCRVEVWGAASAGGSSSVDIVYEVVRADGSVAARSAPKPLAPDATGVYADVFKLTLNRPGEYEVRLQARDRNSGGEAVARRRFVVTPAAAARD